MNKEIRALVIIYNGYEFNQNAANAISEIIGTYCNVDTTIDITEFAKSDIENVLLKNTVSKIDKNYTSKKANVVNVDMTAEDAAIIYIGEKFKSMKNTPFLIKVSELLQKAINNPGTEESKKIINTFFILSQPDLVISEKLLKKYNLDNNKIKYIQHIYNMMHL